MTNFCYFETVNKVDAINLLSPWNPVYHRLSIKAAQFKVVTAQTFRDDRIATW